MNIIVIVEGNPCSVARGIGEALGENMAEVICDALHCYANHPESWAYPDELDEILVLIRAFAACGFDSTLDEFSVAKKHSAGASLPHFG